MTIPLTKLIRVAKTSPHHKNKHSTLVFRGGSLISSGFNHGKVHSEVSALNRIWPNKRRGLTIVNLMIKTKSGNFGNSRPCEECMPFLKQNGITKVIYFDKNEFREERI